MTLRRRRDIPANLGKIFSQVKKENQTSNCNNSDQEIIKKPNFFLIDVILCFRTSLNMQHFYKHFQTVSSITIMFLFKRWLNFSAIMSEI